MHFSPRQIYFLTCFHHLLSGGITKDNVQELSGCGLCGIAVISAIFAKPDIKKATEELKAATEKMVKAC